MDGQHCSSSRYRPHRPSATTPWAHSCLRKHVCRSRRSGDAIKYGKLLAPRKTASSFAPAVVYVQLQLARHCSHASPAEGMLDLMRLIAVSSWSSPPTGIHLAMWSLCRARVGDIRIRLGYHCVCPCGYSRRHQRVCYRRSLLIVALGELPRDHRTP